MGATAVSMSFSILFQRAEDVERTNEGVILFYLHAETALKLPLNVYSLITFSAKISHEGRQPCIQEA